MEISISKTVNLTNVKPATILVRLATMRSSVRHVPEALSLVTIYV